VSILILLDLPLGFELKSEIFAFVTNFSPLSFLSRRYYHHYNIYITMIAYAYAVMEFINYSQKMN
jgi:hypothetical protein